MINKDRWVEIMRAAGLKEQDMQNWHKQLKRWNRKLTRNFWNRLASKRRDSENSRMEPPAVGATFGTKSFNHEIHEPHKKIQFHFCVVRG